MDGRHRSEMSRRCVAASIATPSGSKARMFEAKDADYS
jgi:hypothetical protein